ncbi:MAG: hypothetical protein M3R13_04680 [Armatimonadota bacterium]|nr:hypothetical protein [Armatimonadota bacterium]
MERFIEKTTKSFVDFVGLFGGDFWGKGVSYYSIALMVLCIGLLLWIFAVRESLARRREALDVLCVMALFTVVLFTSVSYRGEFINDTRFLVPSYFMAILLISRELGRTPQGPHTKVVLAGVLICSLVACSQVLHSNRFLLRGSDFAARISRPVDFLSERGLTDGYADLWAGHLLRVESGNTLDLATVSGDPQRIIPRHWATDARWLRNKKGNFVVLSGVVHGSPKFGEKESRDSMESSAINYWGVPNERHVIDDLVILIWDSDRTFREEDIPEHLK